MKGIVLKDMENYKYKTIKNIVGGRISKESASVLLDLSTDKLIDSLIFISNKVKLVSFR